MAALPRSRYCWFLRCRPAATVEVCCGLLPRRACPAGWRDPQAPGEAPAAAALPCSRHWGFLRPRHPLCRRLQHACPLRPAERMALSTDSTHSAALHARAAFMDLCVDAHTGHWLIKMFFSCTSP